MSRPVHVGGVARVVIVDHAFRDGGSPILSGRTRLRDATRFSGGSIHRLALVTNRGMRGETAPNSRTAVDGFVDHVLAQPGWLGTEGAVSASRC